jgi:hypothetical protein
MTATRAQLDWLAARRSSDPQAEFEDPRPLELANRIQRRAGGSGGGGDEHALFWLVAAEKNEAGRRALAALETHWTAVHRHLAGILQGPAGRQVRMANSIFLVQKDIVAGLVAGLAVAGGGREEDEMLEGTVP